MSSHVSFSSPPLCGLGCRYLQCQHQSSCYLSDCSHTSFYEDKQRSNLRFSQSNHNFKLSSNATVPYTDISLYSLRSSKIQLAVWLINHIHIWSLALPHRQKLRHDSIIKYQLRLWSSFRSYLGILCHTLTASFHIEKLWMNYCYFIIQMNDFFRVP